jgi:hypothetical protein
MKWSWPNFEVVSRHTPGETDVNHETSARIAGLRADISIWYLPNTKEC